MNIVPGKLGYAGKQKEIQGIFLSVMGMEKSLHQQKAVDGKRDPADIPGYPVERVGSPSDGKQGLVRFGNVP